jgi:hypothetical protein
MCRNDPSRKLSKNQVGRRIADAGASASTRCSASTSGLLSSACSASSDESRTIRPTPAAAAALMISGVTSAAPGWLNGIKKYAASLPVKAGCHVSRSSQSKRSQSPACGLRRPAARTRQPRASASSTTTRPVLPVAPTTVTV